jgi:hypothetical protein
MPVTEKCSVSCRSTLAVQLVLNDLSDVGVIHLITGH